MDLQVLGRSPRTIRWYQQKIGWYLRSGGVETLEQLTAFEFKRYLADLQGRGLAPNTVHGCFETLKAYSLTSCLAVCRVLWSTGNAIDTPAQTRSFMRWTDR